ncbi:MAG: hypothetical protein KGR26_15585, partial [Cyanobacteria bacterium REEB65]|nr:hypothetical protein [Cyanobacteria bacterium REEB65]
MTATTPDPSTRLALHRILVAAFLRAVAIGFGGILLGLSLAQRGWRPEQIGMVVSAGLAGAAVASALAGSSERVGRRRFLIGQAIVAAGVGVVLPRIASPDLVVAAAFGGMVNGMGRDRGAALVIETALLPGYVSSAARTWAFAWYTLAQDVGHALGALLAGLPGWLALAGVS